MQELQPPWKLSNRNFGLTFLIYIYVLCFGPLACKTNRLHRLGHSGNFSSVFGRAAVHHTIQAVNFIFRINTQSISRASPISTEHDPDEVVKRHPQAMSMFNTVAQKIMQKKTISPWKATQCSCHSIARIFLPTCSSMLPCFIVSNDHPMMVKSINVCTPNSSKPPPRKRPSFTCRDIVQCLDLGRNL